MFMRSQQPLMTTLSLILFWSCTDEVKLTVPELPIARESINAFSCSPQQSEPYPQGIPYVGIHGNAGNSDFIDCQTSGKWRRGWHALRGLGMTQPNTFSPNGQVTYVTTTNAEADGCRLFAIDVESGQFKWCRSYHTSIERSSVEVDDEGNLYFTGLLKGKLREEPLKSFFLIDV